MIKKNLNQNGKYVQEFLDAIEPDFIFSNKPINRFKIIEEKHNNSGVDKTTELSKLRERINAIENCNLKTNSKNLVMGDGNTDSSIMLIGETPGELEDKTGHSFQGEIGILLKKMLLAINIDIDKVYRTYSINFRAPGDRKPTAKEIKRYSIFLKQHISIINPEILVLMGSTAMEAVIGSNDRISNERGKWKDIILKSKTIPLIVTYSPSYLIRFPENKKYSWEDLKKIKDKIQQLKIKI
tara:strand:- start:1032 stop:1751 length:720 start_codon:yes stop_codon:yes gene_type:complete